MSTPVGLNLVAEEALRTGDVERLRHCLQESLSPEMTLRCIYATKEYDLLAPATTGLKSILEAEYAYVELRHQVYLDLLVRNRTEDRKLLESNIEKKQLYDLMIKEGVNIFSLRGYQYTNVDLRFYFELVLVHDAYQLFSTMEQITLLTLGEEKTVTILADAAIRSLGGSTGEIIKHLLERGMGEQFATYCVEKIRRSSNGHAYFPLLRDVCSLSSCPQALATVFTEMKFFSGEGFRDLVRAFSLPLSEEQKSRWRNHNPQLYDDYFCEGV